MAATPIQEATPFLADAAHLLKTSAPETSAHLMLHCTTLLRRNGIPLSSTHLQQYCGTCGEIMVPGHDAATVQLERSRAGSKRKPKADPVQRRAASQPAAPISKKQITCGRCHRKTTIKLEQSTKAHRQQRQRPKPTINSLPSASPQDTPALKNKENASSKKRAKNRKAGLQSLLAAGQNQKSKSLSLSDFMR